MPEGGIEVAAPFGAAVAAAMVNGVAERVDGGTVRVGRLPATVVFQYATPLARP
jgi:hypothetical protein